MARAQGAQLEELRTRLGSLATLLGAAGGGGEEDATPPAPSPPRLAGGGGRAGARTAASHKRSPCKLHNQQQPLFTSTVGPASSVLRNSTNREPPNGAVGALLARQREAEAAWTREKGQMALAARHERVRAQKLEGDLRRAQEQVSFRVGEVKHLKAALQARDAQLAELGDRLRELELIDTTERTSAQAVQRAEGARRGSWW